MRDSINYNLKYFIMRMSGTKPMKNTMRKQSPMKMMAAPNPAGNVAKKVTDAAMAIKAKKAEGTKTGSATMATGKPARPTVKGKVNLEKTPAMQLKKAGKSSCK